VQPGLGDWFVYIVAAGTVKNYQSSCLSATSSSNIGLLTMPHTMCRGGAAA
jgi:hypothetical protein